MPSQVGPQVVLFVGLIGIPGPCFTQLKKYSQVSGALLSVLRKSPDFKEEPSENRCPNIPGQGTLCGDFMSLPAFGDSGVVIPGAPGMQSSGCNQRH